MRNKKKVFTFTDVLYSTSDIGEEQKNAGSEIPEQDGVIFQEVFNSSPENVLTSVYSPSVGQLGTKDVDQGWPTF